MKTYEQFSQKPEIKRNYHKNGQKKSERWYLNNKWHRENGPAFNIWYENGQKEYEEWYLNGKGHREDGPAYQNWYEDGQKREEGWWLNNKIYSRKEWIEKLKEINSPYYDEQKMLYDMEKYNL